jgi:2-methylcitrate dehydratase
MPTISRTLAEWASGLRYEDISAEAVDAAKRFLYDSIGCALGGVQRKDCGIAAKMIDLYGGAPQATMIGSGKKTNVDYATLYNALAVRAMDFNDIYWKQDPCHPSDVIPAATTVAEWKGLSGKEMIVGIIIAYEIEMRLCEAAFPGIRERGWHHATLTGFTSPLVAGRLLNLNPDKMQHALGIGSCHSFTLGCAVAGKLSMMKNTVSPMATQAGVTAAILADKGYTGPEGVIDGKEGMVHCLGPEWKLNILTDGLSKSWRILECGMKAFPVEALIHAPLTATFKLLRENNLKADDVKEIRIESIARAADILSDPSKYEPKNKETADHSLPYCITSAMVYNQVSPRQFEQDAIDDPRIMANIRKVKVTARPDFEKLFPAQQANHVTVVTNAGASHELRVNFPKGDPRDPMTLAEISEKFNALAAPIMTEKRRQEIYDAIDNLDKLNNSADFMALCVQDK